MTEQAEVTKQKGTVLIVDDDQRNIYALSAILRAYKIPYVAAADVKEALGILVNQKISCVLLDMMMPEIDGYSAIPLIRNLPGCASMPIAAVTAQAMKGDREKCLAAGADEYFSKPLDVDAVIAYINRII